MPRRNVKFNHRANGHSEGRRSSFSDISEAASEDGNGKVGDLKVIVSILGLLCVNYN